MPVRTIRLHQTSLGGDSLFFLIAGPCVIESQQHCLEMAGHLKEITSALKIPFIFKASYDKANRTSIHSYRGPGLEKGLKILEQVRKQMELPVISDVHNVTDVKKAAEVLDVLQIPAFLCRQTDLIVAAASTGKIVNIKKGQFLAPWDMKNVLEKVQSTGTSQLLVTERGVCFGYNNLVVDFKSIPVMRGFGFPVVFDATHSVQLPGGAGTVSSGQAEWIPYLARAATAVGTDGVFLEVHDRPQQALSDGPNSLPIEQLKDLLKDLKAIDELVKRRVNK